MELFNFWSKIHYCYEQRVRLFLSDLSCHVTEPRTTAIFIYIPLISLATTKALKIKTNRNKKRRGNKGTKLGLLHFSLLASTDTKLFIILKPSKQEEVSSSLALRTVGIVVKTIPDNK